MSEANWFIRTGDQEFGPLSETELQTLAARGTFGPSSFASTDRQSWRLLRDLILEMGWAQPVPVSPAPTAPPPPAYVVAQVVPATPLPPPAPIHFTPVPAATSRSAAKPANRGTLVMVLSTVGLLGTVGLFLVGLLCLPLTIPAPIAWWLAASDLQAIRRGLLDPRGTGRVKVGAMNGMLGTLGIPLGIVFNIWLGIRLAELGGWR